MSDEKTTYQSEPGTPHRERSIEELRGIARSTDEMFGVKIDTDTDDPAELARRIREADQGA